MGLLSGLIKGVIKHTVILAILGTIIVLIPNLPPYTKFSSIELEPTQPRTGPLAPNDILNNANKLYLDKLLGPEAFQVYKGELYTSLATGEIVKVSPEGHVTFVTKIGQPCTGLTQEHICGRPLGFVIDEKTSVMYIADAYLGIWKVDIYTDKKKLLVSPRVPIEGKTPQIFNSVALAKNGDLYWTDSSSDFLLKDGSFTLFADPSGRLFHYNAAKNQSKVLLDDLWFANGVAISPDGQFVVVAETFRYRLVKYYIDGLKKGKHEVFVAGLPGSPDNVRALPDGSGVLAGLYTVFDSEHPLVARSLAATPAVRKLFARLFRLVEIPFEFLNSQYPHFLFEDVVYYIGHFKSLSGLTPPITGLVQIDWNGNVVASYFNTDRSLSHISDAVVYNDRLLTGSPHKQNFIGSVPAPPLLKKAFGATSSPKETPKVEKPVQKPVSKPAPEKKEVPKVVKPQEVPKTTPPPKQTAAKPVEKKETPKPTTTPPPKTTTPPPKTTTPSPKTTTPPPKTTTSPPKTTMPPSKTTTPPSPKQEKTKPVEPKLAQTKPSPKPTENKSKEDKPAAKPGKPETKKEQAPPKPTKPAPEQIPIVEEIPSDTAKPSKEKLKVIKKQGPTEIPNPNL